MNGDTFQADLKMFPNLVCAVELLQLFACDELAETGHSVPGGTALVHTIQVAHELRENLVALEQQLVDEAQELLKLE